MAATVNVHEYNGAGPTESASKTGGTFRCKMADNATVDLNDSMPKAPGAGFTRSWVKHSRLKCTVAPATQITNGVFYVAAPVSGETFEVKRSGSYTQSVAPPSDDTGFTANPTAGSPITFLDTTFTGTGSVGDYVDFFIKIDDTVVAGLITAKTGTWQYDEI